VSAVRSRTQAAVPVVCKRDALLAKLAGLPLRPLPDVCAARTRFTAPAGEDVSINHLQSRSMASRGPRRWPACWATGAGLRQRVASCSRRPQVQNRPQRLRHPSYCLLCSSPSHRTVTGQLQQYHKSDMECMRSLNIELHALAGHSNGPTAAGAFLSVLGCQHLQLALARFHQLEDRPDDLQDAITSMFAGEW